MVNPTSIRQSHAVLGIIAESATLEHGSTGAIILPKSERTHQLSPSRVFSTDRSSSLPWINLKQCTARTYRRVFTHSLSNSSSSVFTIMAGDLYRYTRSRRLASCFQLNRTRPIHRLIQTPPQPSYDRVNLLDSIRIAPLQALSHLTRYDFHI